jgi:hypothetical protein
MVFAKPFCIAVKLLSKTHFLISIKKNLFIKIALQKFKKKSLEVTFLKILYFKLFSKRIESFEKALLEKLLRLKEINKFAKCYCRHIWLGST